jgi:hypothetical protein
MFDGRMKGITCNAELAGQWGAQQMHSIERDVRTFNTVTSAGGVVKEQATTLLELAVDPTDPTTYPYDPNVYAYGPSTAPSDAILLYGDLNYPTMSDDIVAYLKTNAPNRDASQNGKLVTNPNSTVTTAGAMNQYFWPSADGSSYRMFYNQGDWFIGNGKSRYRPAYTIRLGGWMGLFDIGYEFEKVPVKLSFSAGIISGDKYPYNEEVSKKYKGFLPLRDINYQGYMVKSIAIFTYRLMPRPLNVATGDLLARANIDDSSNLRFFGFGIDYAPLKDQKKLQLNANVLFFWEDADLCKWDLNGSYPVPAVPSGTDASTWNEYAIAKAREDSRNAWTGNSALLDSSAGADLHGWQSSAIASKQLGTELNAQATYRMTKNSDVIFRGGFFIPGQLYKDLIGQPNILTRTWIQNDIEVKRSLGADVCYAWNIRFQYIF